MEKRHGLDAIGYLIDPPNPTGETSSWRPVSVQDRRRALLRSIAVKQRELTDLNAQLESLYGDETPAGVEPPSGPFRWLSRRLFGEAG